MRMEVQADKKKYIKNTQNKACVMCFCLVYFLFYISNLKAQCTKAEISPIVLSVIHFLGGLIGATVLEFHSKEAVTKNCLPV